MSAHEIAAIWRHILRLHRQPHRRVFMAVAEGLLQRLEVAGVTEAELDAALAGGE